MTPISRIYTFRWKPRWPFHATQSFVKSRSFYEPNALCEFVTPGCYAQYTEWIFCRSDAYPSALPGDNCPSRRWLSSKYWTVLAAPAIRGKFHLFGDRTYRPEFSLFGVVCIPEPVLPGFTTDKTPLLVEFADKRHVSMSDRRWCYSSWREFFKVRMTVLMPIAVSRTPAPLKAMLIIRSLTPGLRAS